MAGAAARHAVAPLSILISYGTAREGGAGWTDVYLDAFIDALPVMIDSGAFTAYTTGIHLEMDGYLNFLRRNGRDRRAWGYVAFDKVGDRAVSRANLAVMYERGFDPIPVLTVDAPDEDFVEYAARAKRVCLAGGVTEETAYYSARIERCHRAAPECRIHGLGFTRGLAPFKTRVSSIDSSSWATAHRYGQLGVYDPLSGVRAIHWAELRRAPFVQWPEAVRRTFVASGLTPAVLVDKAATSGIYSVNALVTCEAWLRYSMHAARQGVQFFFALVGPPQFNAILLAALTMHEREGIDIAAARARQPEVHAAFLQRRTSGRLVELIGEAVARLRSFTERA